MPLSLKSTTVGGRIEIEHFPCQIDIMSLMAYFSNMIHLELTGGSASLIL